jgi:hypothetical protein
MTPELKNALCDLVMSGMAVRRARAEVREAEAAADECRTLAIAVLRHAEMSDGAYAIDVPIYGPHVFRITGAEEGEASIAYESVTPIA